MERPYVWQMIKEAVENLSGVISYSEIRNYINTKWNNVNPLTITDQIQVLTVNHKSRIHYPENNKPRLTNSGSPYDLLFTTGRGKVIKYSYDIHGIWEIYKNENNGLAIQEFVINDTQKVYTPADIIWFKNVTNTIDGEAYLSLTENEFILHFPTRHKRNVLSPAINELILIYQKVNGIKAFTHLVTPIDNILIDATDRPKFRYGRRVKVVAKTHKNNFIPVSSTLWKKVRLSGVSQGNACEIDHIRNVGNSDELRLNIWQLFIENFVQTEQISVSTTAALINEIATSNPDLTVTEGELRLVAHFVRERNRKIVIEKKQQAIKNNNLNCEVCTFSFIDIYNSNFIECHHLTPIAQIGVRETSLDDLCLVCANCHRMLHSKFDGEYLTPKQLSSRIKSIHH